MISNQIISDLNSMFTYISKKLYPSEYNLLNAKIAVITSSYNFNELRKDVILLEQLLISGEDHRFRFHVGFDILGIIRAIRNNLFYGRHEGASTISQQFVRVLTNQYEVTISRKIKEIILALSLIDIIPKTHIPIAYLFVAYYGPNLIGLENVAKKMSITDLRNLSLDSAAEIIARIKYPETESNLNSRRLSLIKSRSMYLVRLYNKHKKQRYFSPYSQSEF